MIASFEGIVRMITAHDVTLIGEGAMSGVAIARDWIVRVNKVSAAGRTRRISFDQIAYGDTVVLEYEQKRRRMFLDVYITGSLQELARVRHAQALLAASGHKLAYDWAATVRVRGVVLELPEEVAAEQAAAELGGIMRAQALWFLAPREHEHDGTQHGLQQAYVGLGFARGAGRFVVVSGARNSIYEAGDGGAVVRVSQDEDAIAVLDAYAAGRECR